MLSQSILVIEFTATVGFWRNLFLYQILCSIYNLMFSFIFLQFAELGGFEEIKNQIETAEKVDAPVRDCFLS